MCEKATDLISAPVKCYPGQAGQDPDLLCFLPGFHNRLRTEEAIPSAQPPDDLCANGSNQCNAVRSIKKFVRRRLACFQRFLGVFNLLYDDPQPGSRRQGPHRTIISHPKRDALASLAAKRAISGSRHRSARSELCEGTGFSMRRSNAGPAECAGLKGQSGSAVADICY